MFLINLIVIAFAGTVTFLLIGFRPADRDEREARLRVGLTAALVLLILISVPLAIVFSRAVEESNIRRTIDRILVQRIGAIPEMEMLDFNFTKHGSEIEVITRLYAPETPSAEVVSTWNDDLSNSLDTSVHLQLIIIPVSIVESSPP